MYQKESSVNNELEREIPINNRGGWQAVCICWLLHYHKSLPTVNSEFNLISWLYIYIRAQCRDNFYTVEAFYHMVEDPIIFPKKKMIRKIET